MNSCRTLSRKLVVSLIVALICLTISPLIAHADEVDDMLAAGEHTEGEVVAAFFARDGQLEAQTNAPYEVTPLMTVDASAARTDDGTLTVQSSESLTPFFRHVRLPHN